MRPTDVINMTNAHSIFTDMNHWFRKHLHQNLFMAIGIYGILSIITLYFCTEWLFDMNLSTISNANLPPSWYENGVVSHFLGTDAKGHDIFYILLLSYKSTLLLTLRTTFYMMLIGAIFNYFAYRFKIIHVIINLFLSVFIVITPLLSVIVLSLLLGDNLSSMLIAIGVAYLPAFINNIERSVHSEFNKKYILADRLDGVSGFHLFISAAPNLVSNYFMQLVALFSQILLAITVITFFNFGFITHHPDLGAMMRTMLILYSSNPWATLSACFCVMFTLILINFISLGLQLNSRQERG